METYRINYLIGRSSNTRTIHLITSPKDINRELIFKNIRNLINNYEDKISILSVYITIYKKIKIK